VHDVPLHVAVALATAEHALPQTPQLAVVETLTHVPLQSMSPGGQAHEPPSHISPTPVHALPQLPQLLLSLLVLVHPVVQSVSPIVWHDVMQVPLPLQLDTAPPSVVAQA
jgi:hypothetical protein